MTLQLEADGRLSTSFAGGRCCFAREVFQRDIGICALCKTDTMALSAALWEVRERCSESTFRYLKRTLGLAASNFPGQLWQADHIIPLSKHGPDTLANLRTLCLVCHCRATALLREGKLL